MPGSTTRATLLRDLCQILHAGEPYPVIGTGTSAGSATTLIDSALILTDADVNLFDGQYIRIDELVGSGPAEGTVRVIRNGGFAGATGTITVGTWTASLESGADYSRWKHIHPATALDFLNRSLRLMRRTVLTPLSLVTNADMEAVTINAGADNWTYTSCTIAITAGYSSTAARVRHGTYALFAQATNAAWSVASATIPVVEGQSYIVSAAVKNVIGSSTLTAYDSTASAAISGGTATGNEEAWQEYLCGGGTVIIPPGCELLSVQLTGIAATDKIGMDDVVVWPCLRTVFDLPSWVEDPGDVLRVGYFDQGSAHVGTNAYTLDEGRFNTLWEHTDEVDEQTTTPYRIRLGTDYVTRPLFMEAVRPYTALSADTDTTSADREVVVLTAAWFIFDSLFTGALASGQAEAARAWAARRDDIGRQARVATALSRYRAQSGGATGMAPGWSR